MWPPHLDVLLGRYPPEQRSTPLLAFDGADLGQYQRAMTRLRRVSSESPGIRRQRRGRGFSYIGPEGAPVADEDTIRRIRALAIPPA
jgi:DNA topoisomerase IB